MGSNEPERQITSDPSLPIIDLSKWTSPSATKSDRLALAKELVEACHTTGFAYIINHGISPTVLDEAFAWSKKFHDMPQEKKMQAAHPDGSQAFRGYSWPGHENVGSLDPWADQKGNDEKKKEKKDEAAIDITVRSRV
jgi:isopenicillin N synthase-like dioxygenase